jgi:UDP-N-acetylmuramate-alanine ligase
MSGDTELRLSQLCFLICEATEHNTPFMLKTPNKTINTNTGIHHKQHCLILLSKFNGGAK